MGGLESPVVILRLLAGLRMYLQKRGAALHSHIAPARTCAGKWENGSPVRMGWRHLSLVTSPNGRNARDRDSQAQAIREELRRKTQVMLFPSSLLLLGSGDFIVGRQSYQADAPPAGVVCGR